MNSSSNSAYWLLLVGVISFLLCVPFFRAVYDLPDEGIFLRGADLILRGKHLYTDFFGFLPPSSYLLTAGWFGLFGTSFTSARTLAVLTIVGIACFSFLACRQASKSPLLSGALTCGWVMMTQWHWMQVSHHWFTTLFSVTAAWAALTSLEQTEPRSLRWPLIAGLMASIATTVTQTRGAWIALAAVTAFLGARKNWSELIVYLLGAILMFVSMIAFLAEQRTLVAAFNDVIAFAISRYASIQYVPYGHSVSILDWPLPYVFPLAAVLLVLVIACNRTARPHDQRLQLCAAFALAGFFGCFPRPDITHIGFSVPLALPLLAFCAAELTRRLRPTIRYAIAVAALIGVGVPSTVAFASMARTAIRAPVVATPRGEAALLLPDFLGMPEMLPIIAAISSKDGFFFYPQMPLVSFLVSREHVSKYEYLIPWYTTPAQYHEACLSAVREASWMVTDRRFADYNYWRKIYPSMPHTKPSEAIQFEQVRDRAFEVVITKGFFELRRRREDISNGVCNAISASASERKFYVSLGRRHDN
jgi:hypothetical protein